MKRKRSKRVLSILLSVLILVTFFQVPIKTSAALHTIDIHSLSDWDAVPNFLTDSSSDAGGGGYELVKFFVTNDNNYLYFRWDIQLSGTNVTDLKSTNLGAALSASSDGSTADGMVWLLFNSQGAITSTIEKLSAPTSSIAIASADVAKFNTGSQNALVSVVTRVPFSSFATVGLGSVVSASSVFPLWSQTNASQQPTANIKDRIPNAGYFNYDTVNGSSSIFNPSAPSPGNGGILNTSNPTNSTMDLNWSAATDDITTQSNLQYKVIYSTASNINTVPEANLNGTVAQNWTTNITNKKVIGLASNTPYYFNVLVKDAEGNENVYSEASASTNSIVPDLIPPTAGASGILTTSNATTGSIDLTWSPASDLVTAQNNLLYKVVYSTSSNISTVSAAETYGVTLQDWSTNLTNYSVTGLNPNTTYYFNVLVKDAASNKEAYTQASASTLSLPDLIPPTAGANGTLTTSNATTSSIGLTWSPASDLVTAQNNLLYKVVYSTSSNISTVSDAETYGVTLQDWSTNLTNYSVTGLNPNTTYYFNVLVKDEASNKEAYTQASASTLSLPDLTPPTAGASGTLTTSNATTSSIDLTWSPASDIVTAQGNLLYKVVYSTSSNISTVSDAETYGTTVQDWSINLTNYSVTGLNPNTTYYFNVLVKDEAFNKEAYTQTSASTLVLPDILAPVVGNLGVLTAANATTSTIDLSWSAANDAVTAQNDLLYKVVYSTTNNISTVSDAETYGMIAQDWSTNILSKTIASLNPGTPYYFNVLVKDLSGNKSAYSTALQSTKPIIQPVPSSGGGSIPAPTPTTATGSVLDSTTNLPAKGIEYSVLTESNGTKTINVKSDQAILIKEPNGSRNPLKDLSKLSFLSTSVSDITLSSDGNIQMKNLEKGKNYVYTITYDLGNNQKINIGKMNVTVSSTGDVDFTTTLIDPYGIITDPSTGNVVAGVDMKLYYADTERNKASGKTPHTLVNLPILEGFKPNDNKNPQISDAGGAYGFMVFPTTDYYIEATKDGYNKYVSPTISVEYEIVRWDFEMNQIKKQLPPVAGNNGLISANNATPHSIDLNWSAANDDTTAQDHLQYKVVYSLKNTLSTVADSELYGIAAGDWSPNITASTIKDLSENTLYYLNVLVRDEDGNINIYSGASQKTTIDSPSSNNGGGTTNNDDTSSSGGHDHITKKPVITLLGNAEFNVRLHDAYIDAGATAQDGRGMDITNRIVVENHINIDKIGDYTVTYNVVDEAGTAANSVTRVIHVTGVDRLSGPSRIDTALAIAKATYSEKVSNVILATSENYPDALAGSVLAYKLNAPILLIGNAVEDQEKVLSYMKENMDVLGKVFILGGTGAVSGDMESRVYNNGFHDITRLGGSNRYETAIKIAQLLNVKEGTPVMLVSGENYPDALSISSAAAINQYPILLVEKNQISKAVKDEIQMIHPSKVFIIGLQGALSNTIESQLKETIPSMDNANIIRIGGTNRFETSLKVANYFDSPSRILCISTGNNFPDSLVGSIYAAKNNAPIILVDRDLSEDMLKYITDKKLSGITIWGGEGAVNTKTQQQLSQSFTYYNN